MAKHPLDAPAKSPLRALVDILSDAVDRIDSQYAAENVPFPTLDVPFEPTHPGNALLTHELVVQQAKIVVAAAEQLTALVRDPTSVLLDLVLGVSLRSVTALVRY
jgi:hypothetical protein